MALQQTGQISIGDIRDFYNSSGQVNLSQYLGASPGVPCDAPVSLSDFYGAGTIVTNLKKQASGLSSPSKADGGYLTRRPGTGDWYTGNFPIDILPTLEVRTDGGTGNSHIIQGNQIIIINMSGDIDYGFNLWYTTEDNPVGGPSPWPTNDDYTQIGDWIRIARAEHAPAGSGFVNLNNIKYHLQVPLGKRLKFGYSAGPNWQNAISNAQIDITFPNPPACT